MPSVTLSDVAAAAGVSLATASRAINGSANRTVRRELADRVLAAAAELRYFPDANAQAMARGRTTTMALIVHDIADPYFSSIAAGVSATAEEHELALTLATTQHVPGRETQFVELLRRQRTRAIVLAGGRRGDASTEAALTDALLAYREAGGTAAVIGQPLPGIDTVAIDNAGGAAELAHRLHERGYRRFAVLAGPPDHATANERRTGFAARLRELGAVVPDQASVASAFTRDGGYHGMTELLDRGLELDAVFAVNDVMAVGAMAAARDAGIEVGHRLGVAGFDDISTLRDVTPALSTVRLPLVEIGRVATELALQEGRAEPTVVQVRGEVVLRTSTPPR